MRLAGAIEAIGKAQIAIAERMPLDFRCGAKFIGPFFVVLIPDVDVTFVTSDVRKDRILASSGCFENFLGAR